MTGKTPCTIIPRKPELSFNKDIEKYWYDGEDFKTILHEALLSLVDVLEREILIYAIRRVKANVTDENLASEISDLIRQEAAHGHQHQRYNHYLQDTYHYDLDKWTKRYNQQAKFQQKLFSNMSLLAMAAAFEHMTALVSNVTLSRATHEHDQGLHINLDKNIASFLDWHAVEELEHKGVCFDLYQHVGGGYLRRILLLPYALLFMYIEGIRRFFAIAHCEKKLLNPGFWWRGIKLFFSKKGIIAFPFKRFFSYYKPSFHPWDDKDDLALIEKYRAQYDNTTISQ